MSATQGQSTTTPRQDTSALDGSSASRSPLEAQLRAELRDWLETHLTDAYEVPEEMRADVTAQAELRGRWERELHEGGWLGASWPVEYGGRGLEPDMEIAIGEELARAGAPEILNIVGFRLVGPVLLEMGTEEQRRRYLPAILGGEELWCQGFSEPDAGSDLAGLRMKATDAGDHWAVDGQKVWTSWAHLADRCILLVRSDADAPKHRGITALLADMHAPGVEVRSIRQLTGDSEFCEVFFHEVEVPKEDVVGEPGDGWKVATRTLEYERGTNFYNLAALEITLSEVVDLARTLRLDPVRRDRLMRIYSTAFALRELGRAHLRGLHAGTAHPAESSLVKQLWSFVDTDLKELWFDLESPASIAHVGGAFDGRAGRAQLEMLESRAEQIYGGSAEVQRNIIGERLLGLPREPRAPER